MLYLILFFCCPFFTLQSMCMGMYSACVWICEANTNIFIYYASEETKIMAIGSKPNSTLQSLECHLNRSYFHVSHHHKKLPLANFRGRCMAHDHFHSLQRFSGITHPDPYLIHSMIYSYTIVNLLRPIQ